MKENDNAVECDRCTTWLHADCAGLSKGEYEILKRKNCKLCWICTGCKPAALTVQQENKDMKEIKAKIDTILDLIGVKLKGKVKDIVKEMLAGEQKEQRIGSKREEVATKKGSK